MQSLPAMTWGPVLVLAAILLTGYRAKADNRAIPIDGISVVVNASSFDDSGSILVLESDVILLANLVGLIRHGAAWADHPIDKAQLFSARRLGALIMILAASVNQVGETVTADQRSQLITQLEIMAGGKDSLNRLLHRCGASPDDLAYWATHMVLAQIQLTYLREQVDLGTTQTVARQFAKGGHPFEGASFEEAQQAYRSFLTDKAQARLVAEWLSNVLKRGKITINR